jgi:hypothetical protein
MFPPALSIAMQHMNEADIQRGLEASRRRAEHAAARREQSRREFELARGRRAGLRTESQPRLRTI